MPVASWLAIEVWSTTKRARPVASRCDETISLSRNDEVSVSQISMFFSNTALTTRAVSWAATSIGTRLTSRKAITSLT